MSKSPNIFVRKIERAQSVNESAIARCDALKVTGFARVRFVTLATLGMHEGRPGYAVAAALLDCLNDKGKLRPRAVATFAQLARASKVAVEDLPGALRYAALRFDLREGITGYSMSFDKSEGTATIRKIAQVARKPRKATKPQPEVVEEGKVA